MANAVARCAQHGVDANLQYAWTLFVEPIRADHGWSLADIQIAFSILIALETWLTPFAGALVDWLGPRLGPKLAVAAIMNLAVVLLALFVLQPLRASRVRQCRLAAAS